MKPLLQWQITLSYVGKGSVWHQEITSWML